ncbi:MAG: 30S ribosomal protein S13 [bacterium]|nr:30S ribosomal protein S13 [bacterium]
MRISGINIPENKQLAFGLRCVYGIGPARARKVLDEAKVAHTAKPSDLNTDDENNVRQAIEVYRIEGDLKREIAGNIKRLKDIRAYRGSRHSFGLPARGQRTKTNSRTRRGNVRKTMSSGKRKADKK